MQIFRPARKFARKLAAPPKACTQTVNPSSQVCMQTFTANVSNYPNIFLTAKEHLYKKEPLPDQICYLCRQFRNRVRYKLYIRLELA